MDFIIKFLFVAIGLVGLEGIRLLFIPRPISPTAKTVAKPKSELILTVICMMVFLLFARFYKSGHPLFFLCFAAACGVNIIDYRNTKLEYDAECFTVSDIWGRKRTYRYEEITKLEEHVMNRHGNIKEIHVGNSVFSWTDRFTDAQYFERLVVLKYKQSHPKT